MYKKYKMLKKKENTKLFLFLALLILSSFLSISLIKAEKQTLKFNLENSEVTITGNLVNYQNLNEFQDSQNNLPSKVYKIYSTTPLIISIKDLKTDNTKIIEGIINGYLVIRENLDELIATSISDINFFDKKLIEKSKVRYHFKNNKLDIIEGELVNKGEQYTNQSCDKGDKTKIEAREKTNFEWPIPSSYVLTTYYTASGIKKHNGIDIAAETGTPVIAIADGIVTLSVNDCIEKKECYNGKAGNQVTIRHIINGQVFYSKYMHLKTGSVLKQKDKTVKKGEKIAEVDNTGESYGAHLHFEIHEGDIDNPKNPICFFPEQFGYALIVPKQINPVSVIDNKIIGDQFSIKLGTKLLKINSKQSEIVQIINERENNKKQYVLYLKEDGEIQNGNIAISAREGNIYSNKFSSKYNPIDMNILYNNKQIEIFNNKIQMSCTSILNTQTKIAEQDCTYVRTKIPEYFNYENTNTIKDNTILKLIISYLKRI